MPFDSEKFSREIVAATKAFIDKKTLQMRDEIRIAQRDIDVLKAENSALVDLVAELAPAARAARLDERGL